jgi:glycosyltransferase involved in cell wall biosynthesis
MAPTGKPKILYVSMGHPDVRTGGAELYALDLYNAIREKGEFEPVFLARTGPPITSLLRYHWGTPFTSVNDDPNQYLLYTDPDYWDYLFQRSGDKQMVTRFFRDFLLQHRPDVVHFQHTLFLGHDLIRMTRNTLPDAPIVHTLHDYMPICHRDGQMVRTGSNQLCTHASPRRCNECFPTVPPQVFFMRKHYIQSHFAQVDLFIAPSEHVRDTYVEWGLPAAKIKVEPQACRPVPNPPDPGPARPRNRFAFFGQFSPYKGTDVLLEAMTILGEDFDGHLWIHGVDLERESGRFKEQLEAMLESVPRETVTFAGRYDHKRELHKLMGRADWVVVPSIWWETGPLVVLEAFLHKRPVICSDIGGMAEKVEDGVSGLHFRRGDPDGLARVMKRAVETPGLWEELRDGIPPVYEMCEHAQVMSDLYKQLLLAKRSVQREPAAPRVLTAHDG